MQVSNSAEAWGGDPNLDRQPSIWGEIEKKVKFVRRRFGKVQDRMGQEIKKSGFKTERDGPVGRQKRSEK